MSSQETMWNTYGLSGSYWQQPSATDKIKQMCDSIINVINEPESFFEGLTHGVVKGFSDPKASSNNSLLNRVSQMITQGVSMASAATLEYLLENAETYDLDANDQQVKDEALKVLRQAQLEKKDVLKTAKTVFDRLNKYHILMGGMTINVKVSSDETMRDARLESSKNSDGVSPIDSLVRCQNAWRTLAIRHHLNPVADVSPSRQDVNLASQNISSTKKDKLIKLEKQTNEIVKRFSHKTCHYTTILVIHYLCNHDTDVTDYKSIIEEGSDIKKKYLERFEPGSARYYFYKMLYSIILWFISPIIEPTIEKAVEQLRIFLKNDVDLLNFIEQKISDITSYYGRIEKGRRDYLYNERDDEAGTFDEYLQQSIQIYGGEYTEENLIKIFNEYIVQNFVPRPTIAIYGRSIPLLSSFLEWIIYGIRKAIVRSVLKKTGIVEKMLTEGSSSIHHALLGLKRLLQQKLTQIVEMIDRSRSSQTLSSDSDRSLAAKKKQIISRQLHLTIEQHSKKLLRFIDIAACNGDERKLHNLDNPVSEIVKDSIKALADIFKWDPISLETVLEDAATDVIETSFISLFEKKESQIETHLQTIFEVFEKNYTYIPQENRAEMERRYREECSLIDENLTTLQEQLARTAVAAALEKFLKNASGERHKAIKAYVEKEKKTLQNFKAEIEQYAIALSDFSNKQSQSSCASDLKKNIELISTSIQHYLRHLSMQLRSPEIEACYTDVRGDLHNIYAVVINSLNNLAKNVEDIADEIDKVRTYEEELTATEICFSKINSLALQGSLEEVKPKLDELNNLLPKSTEEAAVSIFKDIDACLAEKANVSQKLQDLNEYSQMMAFNDTHKKIENLAVEVRAHHDLQRPNIKFPTTQAVSVERERLKTNVSNLYNEIMANRDPNIKEHILPMLKASNLSELYKVFYSNRFKRAPILMQLDKIKHYYKTKIEDLKKTDKEKVDREIKLQNKKREGWDAKINKSIEVLRQILENNKSTKQKCIQKSLNDIQEIVTKQVCRTIYELTTCMDHFNVKGCISIGEIKLYNTLAPELIARIAPEIIKGTRALTDAMGKPFHYKQLMLRLFFLDIARRQAQIV